MVFACGGVLAAPMSSTATAATVSATPTITALTLLTPHVDSGDQVRVAWTGDDGGQSLFAVEIVYADANAVTHRVVDGVGGSPTTGTMSPAGTESWSTGFAWPTKVSIYDSLGNGREYRAGSPTKVYAGGVAAGYEAETPGLFDNLGLAVGNAAPDTTPPVLNGLSVKQTRYEPGDTVSFLWSGSDQGGAITQVQLDGTRADGEPFALSADYAAVVWSGAVSLQIPADWPSGVYGLRSVSVFDGACNERNYHWARDVPSLTSTGFCGDAPRFGGATSQRDVSSLVFGVGAELPSPSSPTAPSDLAVQVDAAGVTTVSWHSQTRYQPAFLTFPDLGYDIRVDGMSTDLADGEATSTELSGLDPATSHTVDVRAYNRFGAGSWSQPLTFGVTAPGRVVAARVSGSFTTARLTWSPPIDGDLPDHYVVTDSVGSTILQTTGLAATVGGIEPGIDYLYVIRSVDAEGQVSLPVRVRLRGTRIDTRVGTLVAGGRDILAGTVFRAASGLPLAHVTIRLQRASTVDPTAFVGTARTTTTDRDGAFALDFRPQPGSLYRAVLVRTEGFTRSAGTVRSVIS